MNVIADVLHSGFFVRINTIRRGGEKEKEKYIHYYIKWGKVRWTGICGAVDRKVVVIIFCNREGRVTWRSWVRIDEW